MDPVTVHIDGPLGRWLHTEYRPPRLAGPVDFLWHFEGATALPRERTGGSKTRFATAFREQVGAAPKAYARIVRFSRFSTALNDGGRLRCLSTEPQPPRRSHA